MKLYVKKKRENVLLLFFVLLALVRRDNFVGEMFIDGTRLWRRARREVGGQRRWESGDDARVVEVASELKIAIK